jgi:hypothetical protein
MQHPKVKKIKNRPNNITRPIRNINLKITAAFPEQPSLFSRKIQMTTDNNKTHQSTLINIKGISN